MRTDELLLQSRHWMYHDLDNERTALCQGISLCNSKGMPFSKRAMRFLRAYGEGVALIKVSIVMLDIGVFVQNVGWK